MFVDAYIEDVQKIHYTKGATKEAQRHCTYMPGRKVCITIKAHFGSATHQTVTCQEQPNDEHCSMLSQQQLTQHVMQEFKNAMVAKSNWSTISVSSNI